MAMHFRATARRLSRLRARRPRLVMLPGAAADPRSPRLARWVSPTLCGPSRSSRNARPRHWDVCDARPRRSSHFPRAAEAIIVGEAAAVRAVRAVAVVVRGVRGAAAVPGDICTPWVTEPVDRGRETMAAGLQSERCGRGHH